ncbi:MAG: GNAT family protein [Bacteroidota bacterium]
MDFLINYILEDDRVLLRPLAASDYAFLVPYALTEPNTWKYSAVSLVGEEGMLNYITDAIQQRDLKTSYPFIVFDKLQQQYVGCTRFYDIQVLHQTAQLGYTWYAEGSRGTGINKRCKFLLLQLAFESLNMERVEFRADLRNEISIAAMKSIGYKVEGILRQHMLLPDGSRRDSIILSILKPEWETTVKPQLKNRII